MSAGTVSIKFQVENSQDVQKFKRDLQDLQKTGGGISRPMQQTSKSIDDVGKSSKTTQIQVRSMGQRVESAGAGMALAGSAAIGLWKSYDNVTDASKKVELGHVAVERAELRLSRAREALTKLQASGTASALDLKQAQDAVAIASGNVEKANFNLENSQEALNEAWTTSATNIIPQLFTGMSGLTDVYEAFKKSTDEQVASFAEQAAAMEGSGISIKNLEGGMVEIVDTGAEMSSQITETGTDFAEFGGTVVETGSDIGEFAGDATEMGGALTEAGSTAIEAGSNIGEFTSDALEASGAVVELGADVTEFSGDALEFGGNMLEAAGDSTELSSSLIDIESALATTTGTAIAAGSGFSKLKESIGGTLGILALLAKGLAFVAGAFEGINLHVKNFGGLQTANDQLAKSIDSIIPGFYNWAKGLSELADPAEQQIANIGDMIPGLKELNEWLTGVSKATEEGVPPTEDMAKATKLLDDELNGLSPLVQGVARDWGLYGQAADTASRQQLQQVEGLKELDSNFQTSKKSVIDFATANGVDLKDALAMTDQQMLDYVLNISELGPTAEQQAEMIQRAAEDFAKAWTDSFDRIKQGQQEFASDMRSALGSMGQELGEEMEVGLSDIEKKVSKGFVGFSDQFFKEIFPEDFLANAVIEGNSPDDIHDELEDLMKDVVDEDIITKEQAKGLLQPMIDYFGENLPGDVEKPIGQIAAELPMMLEKWKPAFLNGMIPVGAAAKDSLKTNILDPMVEGLKGLGTGASGVDFGRNFLATIQSNLGAIREEAGKDVADFIGTILNSKDMGLDEKVQTIISTLGQVNEAWAGDIMQMDKDADGIADIVDNKILGPVETMKLGILEAFQVIFEAMGNTTASAALQKEIDKINGITTGAAEGVVTTFDTLAGQVTSLGEPIGQTFDSIAEDYSIMNAAVTTTGDPMIDSLNAIKTQGFEVVARSADDTVVKIQDMQGNGVQAMVDLKTGIVTNSDGSITSLGNLQTAAENTKAAIDAIMEGAKQKQDQEDILGFAHLDQLAAEPLPEDVSTPATAEQIPAPNLDAFKNAITGLGTWLAEKMGGLGTLLSSPRDITMPGPNTSIATQAIGALVTNAQTLIGNLITTLTSTRSIEMPPPNTSIATQVIGAIVVNAQTVMGNLKATLDSTRNIQMPGPDTSVTEQALTDLRTFIDNDFIIPIIDAMNKFKTDFNTIINDLVSGRDVSFPAGGGSLLDRVKEALGLKDFSLVPEVKTAGGETGTGTTVPTPGDVAPPDFTTHKGRWDDYYNHVATVVSNLSVLYINDVNALGTHALDVGTNLGVAIGSFVSYTQAVGGQVNAIGQQLTLLAAGYNALAQGVAAAMGLMIGYWGSHAGNIASVIQSIGGGSLMKLAAGYNALTQGVSAAHNIMNNSWRTHQAVIAQAASSGANSVSRLASAVSSNMRSIVSSANSASGALRNLQSSINALHGKTIYVTTVRRTVGGGGGTVSAATGFSGVVTQPTTFKTGEGNRPELVQVTPLSGAGGRTNISPAIKMGAMFSGAGSSIVRAGGSSGKRNTERIIITPQGDMVGIDRAGRVKIKFMAGQDDFGSNSKWMDAVRKRARKFKGLKGAEALDPTTPAGKKFKKKYREDPTKSFLATGLAATVDPLMRGSMGIRGRGGRSLFDLGIASGKTIRGGGSKLSFIMEEKRYADGSYFRRYNTGAIEFGQDKFKKKKKKAAMGLHGIISSPTSIDVAEGGRKERVDITPMNERGARGGTGGKPVMAEIHNHIYIDGKHVTESVRKTLLDGLYSV